MFDVTVQFTSWPNSVRQVKGSLSRNTSLAEFMMPDDDHADPMRVCDVRQWALSQGAFAESVTEVDRGIYIARFIDKEQAMFDAAEITWHDRQDALYQ